MPNAGMLSARCLIPATLACLAGCGMGTATEDAARLHASPSAPTESVTSGAHAFDFGGGREGVLFVPEDYRADVPSPLVVLLHGAGGRPADFQTWYGLANEENVLLVVPKSRGRTWDVVLGGYGPDVDLIDLALVYTFARCSVDPARVAVGGFSDGASYALSLGLTNGDLFGHILGFSPGFIIPEEPRGSPDIFISHGTEDQILSVGGTRSLVEDLRAHGYRVTYREFDGGHIVPEAVGREAFDWWLDAPRQ